MLYIMCMIRTQIYLPQMLYKRVKLLAKAENVPTAEVVRELLADALNKRTKGHSVGKALLGLATIGGKGPTDLSSNIDKYLYEE